MTWKNVKISVLSYFYIAVILDGLQRLSGLYVIELLKLNSEAHENAAVPFIFSWAVADIVASFSDILINKKHSQFIIIFGVLLSATGAALCALDKSISSVIIFWGFIFGSGYGLASPHISRLLKCTDSSNSPFIAQITSSAGALIMPFVLCILMSQYGLQGSYLMFSGIILNYLPLALAASYDIEICIPNVKWRVRKKSSQYYVSKQEQGKEGSIESFNNCLEPDLILKVNNVKEFRYKKNKDTSPILAKEAYPIGRKRSDTRGNDLPSLEMNKITVNGSKIYPQIDTMLFEGSFCSKDIIQYEREDKEFEKSCNECHKLSNNIKVQDKTMFNATKHELSIKNEVLPKVSEYELIETVYENEELQNGCLENNTQNIKMDQAEVESTSSKINKGSNIVHCNSLNIKEKKIPFRSDHEEKESLTPQKSDNVNVYKKEKITLSPHPLNSIPIITIPVDIKVHVEEYTITNGDEYWKGSFTTNYLTVEKCSGVNCSNSVSLNMHESIKTISQSLSQRFTSSTEMYKPKLSKTHSVSEDTVFTKDNRVTEQNKCYNVAVILRRSFKLRNMILSPVCMCIILMTIILQINLVLLLTVFADFANKIGQISLDFKWIIVAFGFGGLIGKLCSKISWIIPEKPHTVCVILYLLTGLTTAGILYSPNFNWLVCFYCILGALESGITYTIPKLILEYTNSNIHHTLSFLKRFMSGITIICFPYVIGFIPDELGDYDFLLQTLSCSSILCAFIAFFLPHLRTTSEKQIIQSLKGRRAIV